VLVRRHPSLRQQFGREPLGATPAGD